MGAMSSRKIVTVVAAACVLLAACGSRVEPLAQQPGGPVQTQGPATGGSGPAGPSTGPGVVGPSLAPGGGGGPPPSILRKDCHGGATDTGVTATTVKLGLVATLTGAIAGQFDAEVEAVDSYFRAINDAGGICGRRFEVLIRDDNGDKDTDLAVATKLAESDHVFAFVGSVAAPHDNGISQVSRRFKMPDLGFPLSWERTESPYTFGVPGAVQHEWTGEGAGGTVWLTKHKGIKQVALFWLRESEVSVLSAWGFEAAILKATNGKVKICHEQPSGVFDINYTNYVVAMESDCPVGDGPLGVYTTMENNGNLKLARAMVGQDFHPAVYAPTFTSYLPDFIKKADGATEGAYIAMPQIPFERLDQPQSTWTPGTYEAKRYLDTLHRYYQNPHDAGSFGAPGWATAALFAETAAFCGANLTRACVLNRLETRGPFSANGFVSPNRPGAHTIYHADLLVQVRNGRFVEVRPDDKGGPPGGPDFWDNSVLFNWGCYFATHSDQFPDAATKRTLVRGRCP